MGEMKVPHVDPWPIFALRICCWLGLLICGAMAAYVLGRAACRYVGLDNGWALSFSATWTCALAVVSTGKGP